MASSDLAVVPGIRLAAASAGIKTSGRLDVVLIELAEGSRTAACFTRNAFCAAPVQVAKKHLSEAEPRYLLINTGNANAGTGDEGLADALTCCGAVAARLGVAASEVLPFSTGVIGEHLPVEKIESVLPALSEALSADSWSAAAEGILTTDTQPKACSRQITVDGQIVTITGIAKGSGMIRPNMATMLAYVTTDANIASNTLDVMWREVVEHSFNRVTVDGDTSTNDAALLVATGACGADEISEQHADFAALKSAILGVSLELAQWLVRDGEGATKFVEVKVNQGRDEAECLEVAYTLAHSPLVKTALFASDPNWGRLLAAIGRADIDALDVNKVSVFLNGTLIAENGCRASTYTEELGQAAMAPEDILIEVDLGRGDSQASVWTSDLSYDYVRINAEYRT